MTISATQAHRARSTAAVLVVAVTLAGCGTKREGAGQEPDTPVHVRLYGSDANMTNSLRDKLDGNPALLSGMTGTAPLLKLPETFKTRLRAVDPSLADFGYAAEAYDAVMIAGLAAESARTVDAPALAKHIVPATTGGAECDSAATCLPMAKAGRDFAYRGVSLSRSGLTDQGEPSSASYGTLHFGRDATINDNLTEYVGAGDERSASTAAAPPPASSSTRKRALKVGALMPHTGRLAYRSGPRFAGAKLAVADLNAAGGVLGEPVEWVDGDDGTDAAVAAATVDRLVGLGVQVIIGASSSSVTKAVIPKIAAAGRILISPSSTSDELSAVPDNGLFFRTAPPDTLQARALADVIMRDGPKRVVVVAREDAYGMGLQHNVQADLVAAGMTENDVELLSYPASAEDFGGIAASVREAKPDAVLIIGYEETATIVRALAARKVGTENGLAGS
ncbi:ABC transporter substrate-binding protein [Dactylosporangium sp. AC04546]|uniref:ABC transporter substrate-binding protein n=1 Tax=Dactylosporangium sp. AC04546 TaxID=2862460 RepID=UPI001EE02943|nr:ABC transporter substrate-binding protein [Dactylosporangium sp. AC04546]WVK86268.1 ABC transporter substrate-binding protein [Dactylosporangium sp. AC04546]